MRNAIDDDEVEQLLRAAQDDALLNLTVNSHIARASSSSSDSIHPDLDRRFQALKKGPTKKTNPPPKINNDDAQKNKNEKNITTEGDNKVDDVAGEDDLFARFAKLKNSLPSYNGNRVCEDRSDCNNNYAVEEEKISEEDEVQKLVQWAVDAARLDPSSPSDDDDDDSIETDDDDNDGDKSDDEDEDEYEDEKKRKRK